MLWRNSPNSRYSDLKVIKQQFRKPSEDDGVREDQRPCPLSPGEESSGSDISSGFWNPTRTAPADGGQDGGDQECGEEEEVAYDPLQQEYEYEYYEGGETSSDFPDDEVVKPGPIQAAKPLLCDETSDWDVEGIPELPADEEERHRELAKKHLSTAAT